MLKLIIVALLSNSCASSLKTRLKEGEVEILPILNIARTSYLKGCTQNSKKAFKECSDLSKVHAEMIREILIQ